MHQSTHHLFSRRLFLEGLKRMKVLFFVLLILTFTVSALIPFVYWIEGMTQYNSPASMIDLSVLHNTYPKVSDISDEGVYYYDENDNLQFLPIDECPKLVRAPAEITTGNVYPVASFLPFVAPLFTFLLFSYLFKRKDSDFYHAIPYQRTAVFSSFYLAGLAAFAAIVFGGFAISTALFAACPYTTFSFWPVLAYTADALLAGMILSSFTALGCALAGTAGVAVVLSGVATVFFRTVFFCLRTLILELPIFRSNDDTILPFLRLPFFQPLGFYWNLINANSRQNKETWNEVISDEFSLTAYYIYNIALFLLVSFLAAYAYKKRASETADRAVPGKISQFIYRTVITLLAAIPFATILYTDFDFSLFLVLLVITLLVYFLYELITTTKLKSMFASAKHLWVVAVCCLVFFCSYLGIRTYYLSAEINPNKVESVSLSYSYGGMDLFAISEDFVAGAELKSFAYEHQLLSRVGYTDEGILSYFTAGYSNYLALMRDCSILDPSPTPNVPIMNASRVTVDFRFKNGKMLKRTFYLVGKDDKELYQLLSNASTLEDILLSIPKPEEVNSCYAMEEASTESYTFMREYEFTQYYEIFYQEYQALTRDQKFLVKGVLTRGMQESDPAFSNENSMNGEKYKDEDLWEYLDQKCQKLRINGPFSSNTKQGARGIDPGADRYYYLQLHIPPFMKTTLAAIEAVSH